MNTNKTDSQNRSGTGSKRGRPSAQASAKKDQKKSLKGFKVGKAKTKGQSGPYTRRGDDEFEVGREQGTDIPYPNPGRTRPERREDDRRSDSRNDQRRETGYESENGYRTASNRIQDDERYPH